MRFLKYLTEEYVGRVQSQIILLNGMKPSGEVFKNPSKAEIKSVGGDEKDVRYLIDVDNKDIYIWPSGIFHENCIHQLKLKLKTHIRGAGSIGQGGKINSEFAEGYGVERKWVIANQNWLSQYINFDTFLHGWVKIK
jgi:hypothetical protein